MSTGSAEEALPDESFAQQEFYVFFSPAARRQSLKKHHDLLISALARVELGSFKTVSRIWKIEVIPESPFSLIAPTISPERQRRHTSGIRKTLALLRDRYPTS